MMDRLVASIRLDENDAAVMLAAAIHLRDIDPEGSARLVCACNRWTAAARPHQAPTRIMPVEIARRCEVLSVEFDVPVEMSLRTSRMTLRKTSSSVWSC